LTNFEMLTLRFQHTIQRALLRLLMAEYEMAHVLECQHSPVFLKQARAVQTTIGVRAGLGNLHWTVGGVSA